MSKVILITGYGRSGKDTLAKAMNTYNPKFMPLSFAEPLKRSCNAAMRELGVEIDFFNEQDKCDNRNVLVEVGEAARRKSPDVFAKILCKKIKNLMELGYNPVITDWRYANEHEVLVDEFGPDKVITVLMVRLGSKPAHQREEQTISEIKSSISFTYEGQFMDGELDPIHSFGFSIAEKTL